MLAVLIGWTLFVPPIMGMGHGSDYSRILGVLGVAYYQGTVDPEHVQRTFADVGEATWNPRYWTSAYLPAWVAITLDRLVTRDDTFHLFFHGAVNLLGAMAGCFALLLAARAWSLPVRLAWTALWMWVLSDTGYTLYYHSFFSEGVAVWSGCIALGLGIMAWQAPARAEIAVGFAVALAMFVNTKVPYSLYALPAAVILVAPTWSLGRGRRWLGLGLAAACLVAGFLSYWLCRHSNMVRVNRFNTVFSGILYLSDTPEEILAELRLPAEWSEHIGKRAWDAESPVKDRLWLRIFEARVSHGKIIKAYLRRPGLIASSIARTCRHLHVNHISYIGAYERTPPEEPPLKARLLASWSAFKTLLPATWWMPLLVFGGAVLLTWRATFGFEPPQRLAAALAVALVGGISYGQIFLTIVGDGYHDLEKHLFIVNLVTDGMLVGIGTMAVGLLASWQGVSR